MWSTKKHHNCSAWSQIKGDPENSTQRKLRKVRPRCSWICLSLPSERESLTLCLVKSVKLMSLCACFCLAAASWALKAAAQMTLTERYEVKSLHSLSFWWYVEEKWSPGGIQFPSRSTTPSGIYDCMCTLSFFFSQSNVPSHFPSLYLWGLYVRVITYFYHCLHRMCPDFRPGYKRAFSSCILSHSQAGPPFFFIWHSAQPSAAHGINL